MSLPPCECVLHTHTHTHAPQLLRVCAFAPILANLGAAVPVLPRLLSLLTQPS